MINCAVYLCGWLPLCVFMLMGNCQGFLLDCFGFGCFYPQGAFQEAQW